MVVSSLDCADESLPLHVAGEKSDDALGVIWDESYLLADLANAFWTSPIF
jgi:hypothetical protein